MHLSIAIFYLRNHRECTAIAHADRYQTGPPCVTEAATACPRAYREPCEALDKHRDQRAKFIIFCK